MGVGRWFDYQTTDPPFKSIFFLLLFRISFGPDRGAFETFVVSLRRRPQDGGLSSPFSFCADPETLERVVEFFAFLLVFAFLSQYFPTYGPLSKNIFLFRFFIFT